MKKFLFLIAITFFACASHAQVATKLPLIAGYTIVNTGTSSRTFSATAGYSGVVIQVNLNKLSGTGAGTVQIQGSLDNVNFANIGSAFTITNVTTQAAYFNIVGPLPVYLKVLSTGSGTESVVQTVYYVLRKFNN